MSMISRIISRIAAGYSNDAVSTEVILSVLLMVLVLSVYEFVIYRVVSHRAFYNKSFNISITVLPFFIATIILCLQSNLVITLGTIGALAIIRYRTAVKDPVDMLYILWSIHTGIICGCQLYEVGILTSLLVSVVLLVLQQINFSRRPYILVAHMNEPDEGKLISVLNENVKSYRVKSRSYSSGGIDFAVEFSAKDPKKFTESLSAVPEISRFSVIEYDAEDII